MIKAKVKMVPTYEVELDGRVFKDFRRSGEWEGMVKLENDDGIMIVDDLDRTGSFAGIMSQVFEDSFSPDKQQEVILVKASPVFIHLAEEQHGDN